jgi:hypothetical protein
MKAVRNKWINNDYVLSLKAIELYDEMIKGDKY